MIMMMLMVMMSGQNPNTSFGMLSVGILSVGNYSAHHLNQCFLDVIASPSTFPCQSMAGWVIVSDLGYSYRIYRACKLVLE